MSRRSCFDVGNQSAIAGATVLFLAAFMLCGRAWDFFSKGKMRSFPLPSVARRNVSDVRLSSVKMLAAGCRLAAAVFFLIETQSRRQWAISLANLLSFFSAI